MRGEGGLAGEGRLVSEQQLYTIGCALLSLKGQLYSFIQSVVFLVIRGYEQERNAVLYVV